MKVLFFSACFSLFALSARGQDVDEGLISFKAQSGADGHTHFQWSCVDETRIAGYTVERSLDGETFVAMTTQAAANGARMKSDYTHTDPRPVPGDNFYRLVTVGVSGERFYSAVQRVVAGAPPGAAMSATIFPNPARRGSAIYITLPAGFEVGARVQLFSITGALLHTSVEGEGGRRILRAGDGSGGACFVVVEAAGMRSSYPLTILL